MSDCIDDRIEGNFVFLAVRATDGSGRRAGVDLPMDPDELARFEGEQGLMAPSDYRIDGYSKDGIVGRMGFAPFRDDSPLEDVNLLCRAVDAASRSDPHAADKVAAWAECWEVDDPRVLAGVAVRSAADPGRGCRGSLDDAAPPMDGPAGDEGMLLFNDLTFDSGFVARMDTLASRFADDFAHGRYDAGTALRETRSLVAEAAMLMETVTGASYGAGAADCAASLALSAVTDAVNGYVDDLVDRNDCDPRVAAANHAERSADPHARPGTLPCLRMFTTAYGKTDETDVFGDGAPVEGMESSSMQLTR